MWAFYGTHIPKISVQTALRDLKQDSMQLLMRLKLHHVDQSLRQLSLEGLTELHILSNNLSLEQCHRSVATELSGILDAERVSTTVLAKVVQLQGEMDLIYVTLMLVD